MADDYASHLPVLKAVCGLVRPLTVLELGSGLHSTPFFLSLPIKRLVSVESDPEWALRVAGECIDTRLSIRTDYDDLYPADFDLVFIDDGKSAAEREFSIGWVLGDRHPPTVIHDAEVYATVISELATNYAVMPTKPETAVCW
jgi:predicted O-methyltransferase YrrM